MRLSILSLVQEESEVLLLLVQIPLLVSLPSALFPSVSVASHSHETENVLASPFPRAVVAFLVAKASSPKGVEKAWSKENGIVIAECAHLGLHIQPVPVSTVLEASVVRYQEVSVEALATAVER